MYQYINYCYTVVIKSANNDLWIKANYLQKGYYRVNYDNDNWQKLTRQLLENHNVSIIFLLNSLHIFVCYLVSFTLVSFTFDNLFIYKCTIYFMFKH